MQIERRETLSLCEAAIYLGLTRLEAETFLTHRELPFKEIPIYRLERLVWQARQYKLHGWKGKSYGSRRRKARSTMTENLV